MRDFLHAITDTPHPEERRQARLEGRKSGVAARRHSSSIA
jgi:hypothetical protein